MVDGTTADLWWWHVADQQPVANAAWGGRRPDGTYPLPVPETDDDPVLQVSRRDLASMVTLGLGTVCGVAGGFLVYGWGGALIAVWLTALPVALLMGNGD